MKKKYRILAVVMLLPFLLSLWAVHRRSVWMGIGAVLSIFLLVGMMPFCRKRENLWLFVMGIYALLPINHFLAKGAVMYMEKETVLQGISYLLTYLEYLLIVISGEEVFMGLVGRILWKRQCKLDIS